MQLNDGDIYSEKYANIMECTYTNLDAIVTISS